jgi:hypothetical protein
MSSKCWCGKKAIGEDGDGRHARHYCADHVPSGVLQRRRWCFAALLRGTAKRQAAKAAK